MKHSFAPRRAFTLIEILVVLLIIGILSALLFPVFSRAREGGRAKACTSNLHQLGLAFQQYAQDSRNKYPLAANYQAWEPGYAHWVAGDKKASMVTIGSVPSGPSATPIPKPAHTAAESVAIVDKGAIFPYVKSTKVYACPSSEFGGEVGLSYSMNCAVSGLATTKVTSPSDIVLLVDEEYPTDGWFFARKACGAPDGYCSTDSMQDVHNGGGNLLFVDGHVKLYTTEQFKLDHSTEGLANKGRLTGSPRFHDRAFGSGTGSSLVEFQTKPGNRKADGTYDSTGLDSCIVAPAATPTP